MASTQVAHNPHNSRHEHVQLRLITGRSKMHPAAVAPSPLSTLPRMHRLGSSSSNRSCKPTDVVVFLRDGSGHEFFLDNALAETAQDLQGRMMESLGLPASSSDIFYMWITSPLLQLQLKPYHIPFKLCRQWPDLLDKFTIATEQQKANGKKFSQETIDIDIIVPHFSRKNNLLLFYLESYAICTELEQVQSDVLIFRKWRVIWL